jgi:hypothetical protein
VRVRRRWVWLAAGFALALGVFFYAVMTDEQPDERAAPGDAPRTGAHEKTHAELEHPAAPPPRAPSAVDRLDVRDDVPPAVVALQADAGAAAASGGGVTLDGGSQGTLADWFAKNAAEAEKNIDEFCADAKKLEHLPQMPSGREHDASSFLTVRIDWEDPARPKGLLHLPEALRQRVASYGPAWPVSITDADLAGLDFSWMAQLQSFDHWNLMAEGPLREYRLADFYNAPIPNFVELYLWTKLRIARAVRTGDFAQASAEIHQLVALLRSTQLVIADMVSVQLLNIERTGLLAAGAPEGLAFSQDDTDLERRVGRSAMYFFFPGVSPEVMKKASACNTRFPCAGLFEGFSMRVTSLSGDPEPVSVMIDATGCDQERAKWLGNARPRSPGQWMQDLGGVGNADVIDRALHAPIPR